MLFKFGVLVSLLLLEKAAAAERQTVVPDVEAANYGQRLTASDQFSLKAPLTCKRTSLGLFKSPTSPSLSFAKAHSKLREERLELINDSDTLTSTFHRGLAFTCRFEVCLRTSSLVYKSSLKRLVTGMMTLRNA